jgi:F0F1-type ATP synthase epsilon subunit
MTEMRLEFVTPAGVTELDHVVHIRFDAPDGSRGILPRHERARVVVEPGAIEVVQRQADQLQSRFVASDGGIALIEGDRVRVATRWASVANDLDELRLKVASRRDLRRQRAAEAKTIAARHETVTRRALAGLRREVDQ